MQYRKCRMVFASFLMFIALLTRWGRNIADEQIPSPRAETGSKIDKFLMVYRTGLDLARGRLLKG